MDINVKMLADLLSKEEGVSLGTFHLDNKVAVGVLFVRPAHLPAVEKFAQELIENEKAKNNG